MCIRIDKFVLENVTSVLLPGLHSFDYAITAVSLITLSAKLDVSLDEYLTRKTHRNIISIGSLWCVRLHHEN